MSTTIRVDDVRLTRASAREREGGLLGWAQCRVDGIWVFANIAVRIGADRRPLISFPARRRGELEFAHVRPLTGEARQAIEDAILDKCRSWRWIP
jgi:DNA-binding cell septation regulator SpoVG